MKNYRSNQTKSQAIISIIMSILFIIIGLSFFGVPRYMMGGAMRPTTSPFTVFAIIWVGILLLNIIRSLFVLFAKNETTSYNVDENGQEIEFISNVDNKRRLEEIEHLYESGLLTKKEYEHKRNSIINQL